MEVTMPPKKIFLPNFVPIFCYAPNDLAPFSYIYAPQKPSFNDEVWTIDFLSTATSANG